MTKEGVKAPKDPALFDDVKSFAAKLGFGSAAVGGDSAFDDFAPEKAKNRIARPKATTKDVGKDVKLKRHSKPESSSKGESKKKGDHRSDAEEDDGDGEKAVGTKGRDWNFGVGPRPGGESIAPL